jgi:DNA-binding NarL/FixJ family response regulator
MNHTYHIWLADDHARFRQEIKKLIHGIPGVKVTAEVGEGHELYALLEKSPPDLILLDISMPDLQGMKATKEIKSEYPEVKVIIMAMDGEDEYLSHAIAAGADGILLKQNIARDLDTAIQELRRGKQYFRRPPETGKFAGDLVKPDYFGGLI